MMNVVWAANTAQFEVRGVIRETLEPLGAIIDKVPCRWLNGRLYPARVTHSMMAAGHPRISFELDLFSALQQHHDEDAQRDQQPGKLRL